MSTEALLALLAKRKAEVARVKTEKPPVGRSRWRLLPSWRGGGDPQFWMDFGQHFVKDATGQVKAVYICTDKTFGKPCQVCEAVSAGILASTDDVTKKRLEEAKSNARVLLNAIRVDGPSPSAEPVILEVPPTVFNGHKGVGGIISLFDEWPTLLDPATGHDIIIEKSGTGKDTRYGVQIAGGSKPVPVEALKKLHDLDKFVQAESEEAARRALASVAAISGLPAPAVAPALSAPTTSLYDAGGAPVYPADVPTTPAPAAVAPAAVAAPAAAPVYAEPVAVAAPAAAPVAAAPVAAAPVAPAVAPAAVATAVPPVASTGDAELDRLLSDLGPAA